MKIDECDVKSVVSGAIFAVVGAAAFILSHDYQIGTALQMGPGYFPALVGVALLGLGLATAVEGLIGRKQISVAGQDVMPLILILAGVLAFSFLIERAGLFVASAALIALACLRRIRRHPVEVLVVYLILVGFAALVFVQWFSLPIPLFWQTS